MDEHTDFTAVLRTFMTRAQRSTTDLARLTGLSINTLKNWTGGLVRHPQFVNDVLKLARALALDAHDTTSLLTAASHPPLDILHAQAQQSGDSALRTLLEAWPPPAAPEPASATLPPASAPPQAPHHQLRAPVADFVGRAREIDQVLSALRHTLAKQRGAIISGVQGMGGIGKTELAYLIAHQLRDNFPDAQIVLNLRGSSATPLTPEQTLQTIIHSLNPKAQLPTDLPSLEQHYRTALHNQRALILADDAADARQVGVLLPPAGSAVLITSRQRFSLPGMTMVQLEQLQADDAMELLRAICPRLNALEAERIARGCGYLPLALRVSGSILYTLPAVSVATYIAQLGDERQRLMALHDPDNPELNVEASLRLSYAQLDAGAQQVFRQLGVFVADFSTTLAQAVVGAPQEGEIDATLQLLLRRNLVMYDPARSRWRLHDLVRDLARQLLEASGEAEAAQWRYARAAVALAKVIQDQYLAGGEQILLALSRFDAERAHIDAARRWTQRHAGTPEDDQLLIDTALATIHIGEFRYDSRHESIPLWEDVRMAARHLGDLLEEGRALGFLGTAFAHLGEMHTAINYFKQALAIAYEIGDHRGKSIYLRNLGAAHSYLGEPHIAINCYERALAMARKIGNRRTESVIFTNLGFAYTQLGNTRRAIDACEEARSIARAIGDRRKEGHALSYLARSQALQGDRTRASSTFAQALAFLQEVGDRRAAAECQWLFGLVLVQHGEREQALPLLHASVAYKQEIGHAKAEEHAALIARLEAGEELPAELHTPTDQRAIGGDSDEPTTNDAQP